MAQTWESLQRSAGRIWKQECIDMINEGRRNLERITVRIGSKRRKDKETPGRISKRMKMLERI